MSRRDAVYAVIPAAGVGRRMESAIPKQYLRLHGRAVIHWAIESMLRHPVVAGAVVALAVDDRHWSAPEPVTGKPLITVTGGAERSLSVLSCLDWLAARPDPPALVLVHDAVRPCVSVAELDRLLHRARGAPDGALLALPVRDTLKREDAHGQVESTTPRSGLWQALTPQCFPLDALRRALRHAVDGGYRITDDAQAMELQGFSPALVEGRATNLKLTRPGDMALLEAVLGMQCDGERG